MSNASKRTLRAAKAKVNGVVGGSGEEKVGSNIELQSGKKVNAVDDIFYLWGTPFMWLF